MAGFKLDDNGDIALDSNKRFLLLNTYQEAVKQRLQIKLKTYRGEWWLDTTYGIPYRDTGDGKAIIGKGFTKQDIDALYIAAIKQDPDVLNIKYFKSEYDAVSRYYDLKFEVQARDGNLQSYNPYQYAWDEETYTYDPSVITSACDVNFSDWALQIHPIVHNDLPDALQPPYNWV